MTPAISSTLTVADATIEFFDFAEPYGFALLCVHKGGKNPVGEGWQTLHSKDRSLWELWHTEGFNIGVHAGASRIIIFDLDSKHGGIAAVRARFDAWCLTHNMAPLPHHVTTASGGQHIFMQVPEGVDETALLTDTRGKLVGTGIDVLTGSHQSIAPGSYFEGAPEGKPSGHYAFHEAPIYEAPKSVIDILTRAPAPVAAVAAPSGYDLADTETMLEYLTEHDEFDSYEAWLAAGMSLKTEFGDAGLDLWGLTHNATVTPDVIVTKWESFASEPKAGGVTIKSLMKRARDLGWKGTVRPSVSSMFGGVAHLAAAQSPSIVPAYPTPSQPDQPDALPDLFRPSGKFVGDFTPPDYIVDTILQRGFCYAFTAQTGVGKTTVAMRLAGHIGTGRPFCGHDVQQGTVLYCAGENPDDIRMRWLGLCRDMGINPDTADVHFTEGPFKLTTAAIERMAHEAVRKGVKFTAVVVDTVAAHFPGDNENDNTQMGEYARVLRSLCTLPGRPCVILLAHPTKGAQTIKEMVPRGGGAFLNEVDGNIGMARTDGGPIVAEATGKFRGPEFAPLNFALKVITDHPKLIDSKGKPIPTIIAEPISYAEVQRREATSEKESIKVLRFIDKNPRASLDDIGEAVFGPRGKSRAQRIVKDLIEDKQVKYDKIAKVRTLTPAAQKSLNNLDLAVSDAASGATNVMPFPVPTRP